MNVMKIAWEIAREGAKKFGGSVKSYFSTALKMAWAELKAPKTAEIRFPYCKKHWVAKITGSNVQYKLQREFLDAEEDGNDIVYADLTNGYYQVSRFGKAGDYKKIKNGIITDVTEKEVMDFFNAPAKGMAASARFAEVNDMKMDMDGGEPIFELV